MMRTFAQILTLVAAVSGLVCVFAAWAATPGLVIGSGLSVLVCMSTAGVLMLVHRRRQPFSPFGPVQKFGLSEDAMHQRHTTVEGVLSQSFLRDRQGHNDRR